MYVYCTCMVLAVEFNGFKVLKKTFIVCLKLVTKLFCSSRQRGRVVRALDLRSGDSEFKSRSNHQLDLFQVVSFGCADLPLANWYC